MTDPDDPIFDVPEGMARLRAVMARLRDPAHGCPWDLEQDFATIAPYTIEEAYEVADAIGRGSPEDLRAELGDLLFQSVFHARMAEEAGAFDIDDVIRGITDKMIARHPHVFGPRDGSKSAAQQARDWEETKAHERTARSETGALDGVALALPALMRAQKLQKRAARAGFDWPHVSGVVEKIAEEAREVAQARDAQCPDHLAEEVGDLLFTVVNLSRHLGVDAETALRSANAKFERRFRGVEEALAAAGKRPQESDLAEMDALWAAVKAAESRAPESGGD